MQDVEFLVLAGDGLEQLLLGLLAIEVVAGARVDQHVQHCLLFV